MTPAESGVTRHLAVARPTIDASDASDHGELRGGFCQATGAQVPSSVPARPRWSMPSPRRVRWLAAGIILCFLRAPAEAAPNGDPALTTIIKRHRVVLLDRVEVDAEIVRTYQSDLQEDGRWPDVDYKNRDRARWLTVEHLSRVRTMAAAYAHEGHVLKGDRALLGKIHSALDHWLAGRYRNPNWWHNTIGVPVAMSDIATLIDEELADERRKGVIAIIGQCRIGGTGANLMDQAKIVMIKACLDGDAALVSRASKAIANEISVGRREGIKDDWSFHQHGACSQPLSYGRVYLSVLCQVGWLTRGTPYEIPEGKRAIVSQFFLNGIQWMTRGIYTAPSTIDRQVSRSGALRGSGDFRDMLRQWIVADPDHAEELRALLACQDGKAEPLVGFRHFPRSDLTIHHRPGFAFFLKTRSKRVKGTERGNGENLRGRPFLHTGDHYIIVDGAEYTDMPPVWEWQRLPGLTMYDGAPGIAAQAFVGGVGDGASGLTAMDYKRSVGVRKLWAYHGDLIVCLLGGWQDTTGKRGLRTTLDQCRLDGDVRVNVGGRTEPLGTGEHQLKDVRWVLHRGIGYVPLSPAAMSIRLGEVEGSWHSINVSQEKTAVKENVFLCDLLHGASPAASGFLIAPGTTAKGLGKLATEPPYTIIRNDRDVQCVRFDDGVLMAAFHAPGEIALNGEPILSVGKPCLALWSGKELRLADPTNPREDVPANVTWCGMKHSASLPVGGKATILLLGGEARPTRAVVPPEAGAQ